MSTVTPEELDGLVASAVHGDQQAFTVLVESTLDEVRCFVALRASDAEMADEAVQSTYVDCFLHLATYQSGRSVLAWLKGIARHRVLLAQRERRRRLQLDPDNWDGLVDAGSETRESTDDGVLTRLRECLAGLSPGVAELVERYYREDLPLTELAKQTSRSRSGLAVTLSRARSALRDCLGRKGIRA